MNDRPAHPNLAAERGDSDDTAYTSGADDAGNSSIAATAVGAGLSTQVVELTTPVAGLSTGYVQALENVTARLMDGYELPVFLHALCIEIRDTVPGADMVGITVLPTAPKIPRRQRRPMPGSTTSTPISTRR